jgi:hypothetical protein
MRKYTARPLRLRNTQWQVHCLQNDAFWPQLSEVNTQSEGSNSGVAKRFMSSAYVTLCRLSNILVTDVVQSVRSFETSANV